MEAGESAKPLKYKTWVLNVPIHCEGCKKKVRKVLHSIDGVFTTTVDIVQQKVIVMGDVDAEKLIKKLQKNGKHAKLWQEEDKASKKTAGEDEKGGAKNEKAAGGKGKDGGKAGEGNPSGDDGGSGKNKKKGSGGPDGGGKAGEGNPSGDDGGGGKNKKKGSGSPDGGGKAGEGNPSGDDGGSSKNKKKGSGSPDGGGQNSRDGSAAHREDGGQCDGGNPGGGRGGGGKNKKKGGGSTDGGGQNFNKGWAPCEAVPADGGMIDGGNPGDSGGKKKKGGGSADGGGQNSGDGGAANTAGGNPMSAESWTPVEAAAADGDRAEEGSPGVNGGRGGKKKNKKGGQNLGDSSAANVGDGDPMPAAPGVLMTNLQASGAFVYPALHPLFPQQCPPLLPPISSREGQWTPSVNYSTTTPILSYGGSYPLPPVVYIPITMPYISCGTVRYVPPGTSPKLEELFSEENATGCSVM